MIGGWPGPAPPIASMLAIRLDDLTGLITGSADAMDPLAKLKLFLLSSDPGHVGVRTGLRVMVTVAAVCLALFVLGRAIPMSAPAYVLGLITAIQGAAQINDPTRAGRAVTRTYAALAGFVTIAGLSVVRNSLVWIDIWLLIVIFLAAYARRFGMRWQAVGMFAFMCGVLGAFLKAPERDLLEIALALLVSGLVAHLVRNWLLPERRSRDFRRVVDATLSISAQLRKLFGDLVAADRNLRWQVALRFNSWLRNDIRMCQGYLPVKQEGPGNDAYAAFSQRLLDLQLASETALDAYSATRTAGAAGDPGRAVRELDAMKEAESGLRTATANLPASFPEGAPSAPPPPPAKLFPARGEWLKDPQVRLALQVTLACALAMVGGRLISSERWFWAVMTAFLIFMNTQSGGAVTVRGISRAMGTLAGIAIGIGLATFLSGDLYVTIPLVGISIFGAFFLARISYAGMNIFINIAISLIYGLVGIFTPSLLVLRLEETAIGALAGILAALLVLPVRTEHTAEQAMDRFLHALGDLIGLLVDDPDAHQGKSATDAAKAVDKALADVAKAYEPLLSFWTMGTTQARTRDPLRRVYLLAHAVHLLEHSFRESAPTDAEAEALRALKARLDAAAGRDFAVDRPAPPATADTRLAEHQTELAVADTPVRYAIEIMSEILTEIEAGK